jgi:hypothetical protein
MLDFAKFQDPFKFCPFQDGPIQLKENMDFLIPCLLEGRYRTPEAIIQAFVEKGLDRKKLEVAMNLCLWHPYTFSGKQFTEIYINYHGFPGIWSLYSYRHKTLSKSLRSERILDLRNSVIQGRQWSLDQLYQCLQWFREIHVPKVRQGMKVSE